MDNKPFVVNGSYETIQQTSGHEHPPAEPENDQFALAANLFRHVVVGM